jgi:hypothetical protein
MRSLGQRPAQHGAHVRMTHLDSYGKLYGLVAGIPEVFDLPRFHPPPVDISMVCSQLRLIYAGVGRGLRGILFALTSLERISPSHPAVPCNSGIAPRRTGWRRSGRWCPTRSEASEHARASVSCLSNTGGSLTIAARANCTHLQHAIAGLRAVIGVGFAEANRGVV